MVNHFKQKNPHEFHTQQRMRKYNFLAYKSMLLCASHTESIRSILSFVSELPFLFNVIFYVLQRRLYGFLQIDQGVVIMSSFQSKNCRVRRKNIQILKVGSVMRCMLL